MLRGATPADVPMLAGIAERSYRAAFSNLLEEDVLASRNAAFFMSRFEASLANVTVVDEDGALQGFLLLKGDHIEMLFMDSSSIGKGYGSRLLRYAEEYGAASLECFRHNDAARRFYERHGWRVERDYEREFAGRMRSFVFYTRPSSG